MYSLFGLSRNSSLTEGSHVESHCDQGKDAANFKPKVYILSYIKYQETGTKTDIERKNGVSPKLLD